MFNIFKFFRRNKKNKNEEKETKIEEPILNPSIKKENKITLPKEETKIKKSTQEPPVYEEEILENFVDTFLDKEYDEIPVLNSGDYDLIRKKLVWLINAKIEEIFNFREEYIDFNVSLNFTSIEAIIYIDFFKSILKTKNKIESENFDLKQKLTYRQKEVFEVYLYFLEKYYNKAFSLDKKTFNDDILNKKYSELLEMLNSLLKASEIKFDNLEETTKELNKFINAENNYLDAEKINEFVNIKTFEEKEFLFVNTFEDIKEKIELTEDEVYQLIYGDLFSKYQHNE